jgi:hypothetical protein
VYFLNIISVLFIGLKGKILSIVEENPNSHFFFDEVPMGDHSIGITAEDLQEVSKKISSVVK